ncbi:putative ankyrin repeat protein like [Verticillium longisporum]|nr:putative ankyrin repeat protein like [Verticillium longisporum]
MAEIIGVVASSYALGQAFVALRKLKAIPEIQQNLESMIGEAALLTKYAHICESLPQSDDMGQLGPELEFARINLKSVADGLTSLCARCCKAEGERSAKAKKLKWLYLQNDIKKMQTEAHSAMGILQGFVGLYAASHSFQPFPGFMWFYLLKEGRYVYYPDDETQAELVLIETMVKYLTSEHDGFNLLLNVWNNYLRAKQLPSRVATLARHELSLESNRSDNARHLLNRVIELSDDDVLSAGTAIHEAARTGVGMREALLGQKRYIDHLDECGQTPLHLAIAHGHIDALDMLLEAKANTNLDNIRGETPLVLAIGLGLSKMCSMLVKAGCDLDTGRRPALYRAIVSEKPSALEMMDTLLRAGANPWVKYNGFSSAMSCLFQQHPYFDEFILEKATLLVQYDARLISKFLDPDGRWIEEVNFSCVPLLRYLVNKGATFPSLPNGTPCILRDLAYRGTRQACEFFETCDSVPRVNVMKGLTLDDVFNVTVWDGFLLRVGGPNIIHNAFWPCDLAFCTSFPKLFVRMRNHVLDEDIKALRSIVQSLESPDPRNAGEQLAQMIHEKEAWGRFDLVSTYRAIMVQVREKMWLVAIESLEEHIEVMMDEMISSPWELESEVWKLPKYSRLLEPDAGNMERDTYNEGMQAAAEEDTNANLGKSGEGATDIDSGWDAVSEDDGDLADGYNKETRSRVRKMRRYMASQAACVV